MHYHISDTVTGTTPVIASRVDTKILKMTVKNTQDG